MKVARGLCWVGVWVGLFRGKNLEVSVGVWVGTRGTPTHSS